MTFDVAIIGGGAAGLSAARVLSGAGQQVCILEARPRLGGRIFTLHQSDLALPIELGAEFIHGATPTTFRIVDAAALPACELPDNHWWSSDGSWQSLGRYWEKIEAVRRMIPAGGRDRSFAEFLESRRRLDSRLRQLAFGFAEGYHAAHADRLSARALRSSDEEQDEDAGGNRQFRLVSGQDAIVEWLRAGLDPSRVTLRLGSVATLVEWSPGRVVVHWRAARSRSIERIRASKLVVTLPIGVWRAAEGAEGSVRFDPPLREKEKALAQLESGHVVKIAFRFREAFWDDSAFLSQRRGPRARPLPPLNFLHSSDPLMPTWWTTAPLRSPILIGWAGGPAADALLAEGIDAAVDRGLDALSRAFGLPRRKVEGMLEGAFTHDWQSDPFSRGAYSYPAVGGANAHRLLSRPLRQTLFFAGEATSGDQTGTVAGAIESGERAAREILRKELRNM